MKIIKKLFLFAFIISIFQMNLNAAEIGSKHEYGISLLGSYEYEERKFMHLRSGSQAEKDQLENLGFLYNYKNTFVKNDYLNEFEFDSSYQFLTQTYSSYGTGTMDDIKTEIYNLRALYGFQLSEKLMLKSGLGYRHLYHYWQDRHSSTGHFGYDREQDYTYLPILAELKMPIPELNLDGKLKLEYDIILQGNNTSYSAYQGGAFTDDKFENNNGYIWKVSYKGERNGINFEPYYEFMNIDNSIADASGSLEPANTTKEIGLRLTKVFNSERVSAPDYKKLLENDNFYFGVQLLNTEVESGFSTPTGTATIDEKDYGYSVVSGMTVLDGINDKQLKLDVELAYNQFGETILFLNNGDSAITDGRFRNGLNPSGTVLTSSNDNTEVAINSYSTTIGIKPSIAFDNGMFVSASLGLNKWDQSEETSRPGSRDLSFYYDGIDTYYGFGIGFNQKNFTVSIEHQDHDMYYDAKSTSASLKYNF
ncbi:hypothetical protein OAM73_01250 [Candidatus Pelagibacter sp.]|nr:hypothetical protein [Candidatus Pelagibacter sp.]